MATREDVGALFTGAMNNPQALYQWAVRNHKKWYWRLMLGITILITVYVVMSYKGHTAVIAVLNAAVIMGLGFYVSSPAAVLALFGIGVGWEIKDYDINWGNLFKEDEQVFPNIRIGKDLQSALDTLILTLKLPAHFMILAIAAGTVLELMHIEHPLYAMMFFPIIATIGVWVFANGSKTKWYRRITLTILIVGAITSFIMAFAGNPPATAGVTSSSPSVKSVAKSAANAVKGVFVDEWQVYKNISCPVAWNDKQGWCNPGNLPVGTYRIVPLYQTWNLGLDNGTSLPVPPKGISLVDNWGKASAVMDEFQRTAPLGHNRMVGSLVVKKGDTIIDPLQQEKISLDGREWLVVGVNLPPKEAYYRQTRAVLQLNIEKLVE